MHGDFGQTDHVLASAIYQGRQRSPADDINASAEKFEALSSKINDRWRFRDPTVEPGLDGVLVRGNDIGGPCCH